MPRRRDDAWGQARQPAPPQQSLPPSEESHVMYSPIRTNTSSRAWDSSSSRSPRKETRRPVSGPAARASTTSAASTTTIAPSAAARRARDRGVSRSSGCADDLIPPGETEAGRVAFPSWLSHATLMKVGTPPMWCPSWQRGPLMLTGDFGTGEGAELELPGLVACRGEMSKPAGGRCGGGFGDENDSGDEGGVRQPNTGRTDIVSDFSTASVVAAASAVSGGGALGIVPSSSSGWAGWSQFRLADSAGDSFDEDSEEAAETSDDTLTYSSDSDESSFPLGAHAAGDVCWTTHETQAVRRVMSRFSFGATTVAKLSSFTLEDWFQEVCHPIIRELESNESYRASGLVARRRFGRAETVPPLQRYITSHLNPQSPALLCDALPARVRRRAFVNTAAAMRGDTNDSFVRASSGCSFATDDLSRGDDGTGVRGASCNNASSEVSARLLVHGRTHSDVNQDSADFADRRVSATTSAEQPVSHEPRSARVATGAACADSSATDTAYTGTEQRKTENGATSKTRTATVGGGGSDARAERPGRLSRAAPELGGSAGDGFVTQSSEDSDVCSDAGEPPVMLDVLKPRGPARPTGKAHRRRNHDGGDGKKTAGPVAGNQAQGRQPGLGAAGNPSPPSWDKLVAAAAEEHYKTRVQATTAATAPSSPASQPSLRQVNEPPAKPAATGPGPRMGLANMAATVATNTNNFFKCRPLLKRTGFPEKPADTGRGGAPADNRADANSLADRAACSGPAWKNAAEERSAALRATTAPRATVSRAVPLRQEAAESLSVWATTTVARAAGQKKKLGHKPEDTPEVDSPEAPMGTGEGRSKRVQSSQQPPLSPRPRRFARGEASNRGAAVASGFFRKEMSENDSRGGKGKGGRREPGDDSGGDTAAVVNLTGRALYECATRLGGVARPKMSPMRVGGRRPRVAYFNAW